MSNASIIDGVLQHVSPSQMSTFHDCKFKWYAEKKLKWSQGEEKVSLAVGTKTHIQKERYRQEGILPEYAHARVMIENPDYPAIEPGELIEEPRDMNLGLFLEKVPVKGKIDLRQRKGSRTYIFDWKTTKTLRYAKTKEELAANDQLVVYAMHEFVTNPECEEVVLGHGYMTTGYLYNSKEKPKAKVVWTVPLQRQHIEPLFEAMGFTVQNMKIVAGFDYEEAAKHRNWSACNKYGGCPYKARCAEEATDKDAEDVMFNFNDEEDMALKDKLNGINPPDAATPVAVVQHVPAPVGALTTEQVLNMQAQTVLPVLTSKTHPNLHLYIGCAPDGVKTLPIYAYVDQLVSELCERYKLTDIRLGAGEELGYGKWKGVLATAVRRSPPSGPYYVPATNDEIINVVVEALTPLAGTVIRVR